MVINPGKRNIRVNTVHEPVDVPRNFQPLVATNLPDMKPMSNMPAPPVQPGLATNQENPLNLSEAQRNAFTNSQLETLARKIEERKRAAAPNSTFAQQQYEPMPAQQPIPTRAPQENRSPQSNLEIKGETKSEMQHIPHRVMRRQEHVADTRFTRIILPSQSIFYNVSDIDIAPFSMPLVAQVTDGMLTKNITLIYDAVDAVLNGIDVRDMWEGDFQYVIIWLRLNSFPRTPMPINWTSIYGNKNKVTVNSTILRSRPLELTREGYEKYVEMGLTVPTIRDAEELSTLTISDSDKWIYDKAQYVAGNSFKEKIQNLLNMDPDMLVHLKDFRNLISKNHVAETIVATDEHFSYDAAMKSLASDKASIENILDNPPMFMSELAENDLTERLQKIDDEITRLSTLTPGEAGPVPETVELNINIFNFFSGL